MRNYGSLICPELTERKMQICVLIAQCKTNKEICKVLGISRITVTQHITEIFAQLGLSCRTQLTIWTIKKGLLTPDEIELPERGKE